MLGAIEWLSVGGYATMGVAAIVLLFALVGDRSRGRRRCRNCWYDMSEAARPTSAAPVICPECGTRTITERQLLKPRRMERAATLALLAAMAGWYLLEVNTRQGEDLRTKWIPTTVLALIAPVDRSNNPQLLYQAAARRTLHRTWMWQESIFALRLPDIDPNLLDHAVVTRSRWPSGSRPLFRLAYQSSLEPVLLEAAMLARPIDPAMEEMTIKCNRPNPLGVFVSRFVASVPPTVTIGPELPAGHHAAEFDVSYERPFRSTLKRRVHVEFDVAPPGEAVLPACDDPWVDLGVRSCLRCDVMTDPANDRSRIAWFFEHDEMFDMCFVDWDLGRAPAVALKIRVLDGERVVHASSVVLGGRAWELEEVDGPFDDFDTLIERVISEDGDLSYRFKPGVIERLRVQVRSSETMAAQDISASAHWSGQFEAPLTDFTRDDH